MEPADIPVLIENCYPDRVHVVRELLEAGVDMEARDFYGNTALIMASSHGYPDVVRVLLEAGADKEAKNNNGYTALTAASRYGHRDVVQLLLEAGEDNK